MKEQEFLNQAQLDHVTLQTWIAEAWLMPVETSGERDFTEIDLARAQLIRDLQRDLGVNDPGISLILHLLDQLHGLRRAVKEMMRDAREKPADGDV